MKPITLININGTTLNAFTRVSLVQKMYDHHSFQIVVGHEIVEELGSHTLDKSKDWLGKVAVIVLGANSFVGVVTSVNMVHNHGLFGDLVISGYSPTILLESGPHLCSWTDKALRDIIDETLSGLKSTVKPKFSGTIGYMAQYRESNYGFIRRVACQYNEWMYYDGEQLIFGEPSDLPTVPLLYGTDVDNVQVSLRVRPVKYDAFTYHSERNEPMNGSTQDSVPGLDELGNHAFKAARETFILNPLISSGPRVPDKGSLDDVLKNRQSAAAADLSRVTGNSTKQELRPGVIADLKVNLMDTGSLNSKPFGRYLVIAVHHQATGETGYSNHFEAIPAGVKILPEPPITMPTAYPQIATVLSNDDPKKIGRIQVQFQWQQLMGLNTNWIRVMTPDAGTSDKVGSNRGFVSIPETGDQVMIGFRYGDPARPFVMGSLFHGLSGVGGDTGNKMKSFTTRSGSTMTMNEDEGSVVMRDAQGNNMHYDGAGNISVTSAETITLSCGSSKITMNKAGKIDITGVDININAGNSINVQSFPNEEGGGIGTIDVSAKQDIGMTSEVGNINQQATVADINSKSGNKVSIVAASNLLIDGGNKADIISSDTDIM